MKFILILALALSAVAQGITNEGPVQINGTLSVTSEDNNIPAVAASIYGLNSGGDSSAIFGGNAKYGFDTYMFPNNRGMMKLGAAVAFQSFITGDQSTSIGASYVAAGNLANTNIAFAAMALDNGRTLPVGAMVGIFQLTDVGKPIPVHRGALVVHSFGTTNDLVVGVKDKTNVVFRITRDGDLWIAGKVLTHSEHRKK